MRSGVVLLVCVALLTTVGADIGRRHAMVSRRKQGKLLAHMPSVSRANVNALRRNAHAVVHKAGQLALHPPPAASPLNTSASPSPLEATPVNASQPASQPQPQPVLATHGAHTMHSGRNPRHSLHIATHEKIQAKRSAARGAVPDVRRHLAHPRARGEKKGNASNTVTVFLHVHKSGGTTLCHLAGAQPSVHMSPFQRAHNCNVPNEGPSMKYHWWSPLLEKCSDIYDYNQQGNSDFMAIESMMHPGIRRCEHVKYATVVREPMERLHSHLVFENILPAHAFRTLAGERLMSADPDPHALLHLAAMFDNLMVRSVLGKDAFFVAPGGINATHLADAKAALLAFDLVLPLELIGRDVWEPLVLRLGWKRPRANLDGDPIGVRYKQNSIDDKHQERPFMTKHHREEEINTQWRNQTLQAVFMQHNTYDLELHKWVLATFNDTWGNPSWRVGQVPEPAQPQIAEQPEPLPPSPPLELAQLLKCGFGRLFASASDSCNQHANARTGPGAGGARGGGGPNVRRSLQSWEETSLQSWEETSLQSSQGTSAPLAGLDASRGRRRTRSSVREMTVYLHLHKSAGTSMCELAKVQSEVRMVEFQRSHNCNARAEGPNIDWLNPTLISCDKLWELHEQGSTYVHIETFFHTGIHNCSGVTYAMVIRHPMERLYSHLTFEHIAATEVKALLLGQTSSSNASYPHNLAMFDNYLIRFLLGEEVFFSPLGSIDSTHVEQVKAVLETMAFILPMQLMGPQAIPLLEEVLGWTMPPDFTGFPHKKAAKHLTSLTMQQMHTEHEKEDALFREFNARSIEVYEWAVGRFEERWGRLFNNPRRNRSR